jgi:cation transport regulator ChaC
MAFKSIGQKYGFVSAGDVYRQRIAKERQKAENAEAELAQASADTEVVLREMGMSDERIAEMQAKLEAMRQSRLAQNKTM